MAGSRVELTPMPSETVTAARAANLEAPATERRAQPELLLAAHPVRAIIRLATPTTLVMAIAATSNVLYTYYVSRLGADAIAAVSLEPSTGSRYVAHWSCSVRSQWGRSSLPRGSRLL